MCLFHLPRVVNMDASQVPSKGILAQLRTLLYFVMLLISHCIWSSAVSTFLKKIKQTCLYCLYPSTVNFSLLVNNILSLHTIACSCHHPPQSI